jgi:hypothetical protein
VTEGGQSGLQPESDKMENKSIITECYVIVAETGMFLDCYLADDAGSVAGIGRGTRMDVLLKYGRGVAILVFMLSRLPQSGGVDAPVPVTAPVVAPPVVIVARACAESAAVDAPENAKIAEVSCTHIEGGI